jgi:hypothetical protein
MGSRAENGGGLSRWEIGLLAALALWMLVPLVVLVSGADGSFNGTYGIQVDDQFQYMAFVREAGENVLISNRYDTAPDPHLFLHPTFLASGLIWQLGASIQLAYLIWQPVAVALLFAAFAAYVRRMLGTGAAAGVGLLLGLFFFTPATPLVHWLGGDAQLEFGTLVMGLELFPAGYPWSGAAATISIALMPVFLLGVERVLDPERRAPGRGRGWYLAWTGVAGLLVSWLHPWQGIILLAILGGLWAWARLDRRYLALALPAALTALPLAYYFALSRTDSTWAQFSKSNDFPHVGWWFVLGLAPAVLALPGFRGRDLDVQERMLRLWPVATLAVYFALQSGWIYQALGGLTLPLAILAVRALRDARLPRAAVALALLAVTVPGMVFLVDRLADTRDDHFFDPGERAALAYVEDAPREGPVIAPERLGLAVPGFTGRATWVGHYQWTPDHLARRARAEALFAGAMPAPEAQQLVRETGSAYVLAGCGSTADLAPVLGPLVQDVRRFGCATVYEVGPS